MIEVTCAECGEVHPRQTSVYEPSSAKPSPGDRSICINCLAVGIFGDDLKLHRPTDDEVLEIAKDERIVLMLLHMAVLKLEGKL